MFKQIIFIFSFILLLDATTTYACTIISVSNGETVLFGGNEDQPPNSSFLVVDKRGTLGVVYFATPWQKWPLVMQMGINEKGLSFDINLISTEKLIPHPERKPLKEEGVWLITQMMTEASTVEEVLSKIFFYNWGESLSGNIHFADKSGDAVVISPGIDGEITYSKKGKGNSYLISTNFNQARREKSSRSFLDFVYQSLGDSKYEIANKMLSTVGFNNELTPEFLASVLKATDRNWPLNTRFSIKTLFSAVYDLQKLRIYLYYNRQIDKPFVLDVQRELAKTKDYRKVSLKDLISNENTNLQ